MAASFNRAAEDMGNIVNLGHANFRVADQRLATSFYVTALGLTRDPYMMTGNDNMWVNVADSQFHLPTGQATQAPVTLTGLVIPDRNDLLERLTQARRDLSGTLFNFHEQNDGVEVTCPWGNRLRCHEPDADRFGKYRLNMAYVEFEVRRGAAARIGRFYETILRARVDMTSGPDVEARVSVGEHQWLIFREMDQPHDPCLAHHIQIYISDFSGPYDWLRERGLISNESGPHQYSFCKIVDPDSGEALFDLDHEVRSMRHPMYGRPLINRNPAQKIRGYTAGHDALNWRTM